MWKTVTTSEKEVGERTAAVNPLKVRRTCVAAVFSVT